MIGMIGIILRDILINNVFLTTKKASSFDEAYLLMLAERTGLEPATPGVTGRYSNQLNYRSFKLTFTH